MLIGVGDDVTCGYSLTGDNVTKKDGSPRAQVATTLEARRGTDGSANCVTNYGSAGRGSSNYYQGIAPICRAQ